MSTGSDMPAGNGSGVPAHSGRVFSAPTSKLGWWAVGLGAAFAVLFLINSFVFMPSNVLIPWREVILPFYGIGMLACGLAAGVVALISVVKRRERSWLVWLTLLPGVMVLALVVGEFLVPH